MTTTNPASEPPRAPEPPDLDPPIDPMTDPEQPDGAPFDPTDAFPEDVREAFRALPAEEQAEIRDLGEGVLDSLEVILAQAAEAMRVDAARGSGAAGAAFTEETTALFEQLPKDAIESIAFAAIARLAHQRMHDEQEAVARRLARDEAFARRHAGEGWAEVQGQAQNYLDALEARRDELADDLA